MTAPVKFCITEDVVKAFAQYCWDHGGWGPYNVVLIDGDYSDAMVNSCREWVSDHNMEAEMLIGGFLSEMSYTQRKKIADKAYDYNELEHGRWTQ